MHIFSAEHLASVADKLWGLVVVFVPRLIVASIIVAVAAFVARRAANGISRLLTRASHVDPAFKFVVAEIIRYAVLVIAIIAALEQVGVKTTSLFAVIGAAGLAIGLALQGTLSNIAAGLMILWLRPFHIGDYVEVNNVPGLAGTVRQTGLFVCLLRTFDGLYLFVPNSALWNVPLRNFTRTDARLVSLTVLIPHQIGAEAAIKALTDIAAKDDRVSKQPAPIAFIDRVAGEGVLLNFRAWTTPADIGALQRDLPAAICAAIAAPEGAPPVQITRIVPPDADPSRLMDRTESYSSGNG